MDIKKATLMKRIIINMGGLEPGGLNFDCKVRRESTDVEDMFISHIGAMDTFARGLRNAVRIISDGTLSSMISKRYSSFDSEIGQMVENETFTMEDAETYILNKESENENNNLVHYKPSSGKQELFEMILNNYL